MYVTNLGYNIYGDEWNGTYNQDDHMLSPAEPEQTRFYIQDKLEFKDVVVQVGVSVESIDTGAMAPDSDGDGYGDSDGFNHLYFNRQRVDRNVMVTVILFGKKQKKKLLHILELVSHSQYPTVQYFVRTTEHTGSQFQCHIYTYQIHSYQLIS